MDAIRLSKVVLVAAIAFLFTLFAFGNLTDYGSNWQFVQHVLSMDTIFPDSTLKWRAITDPGLQSAAYWGIIGWEILTALVLWIGALRLLGARDAYAFDAAKSTAVVGLVMGIVLYGVGFVAVGGEWFAMWQSETWNGQSKAFEFISFIGLVLIVLLIRERTDNVR
jgi:predicted small integral membrane protein